MLSPGSVAVLSLAWLVSLHVQPVSLQCWGLLSPWTVRAASLMQGLGRGQGPGSACRLPVSGVLSLRHTWEVNPVPGAPP